MEIYHKTVRNRNDSQDIALCGAKNGLITDNNEGVTCKECETELRKAEILAALKIISDDDLLLEFQIHCRRLKPLEHSLEVDLMKIEILQRMNK